MYLKFTLHYFLFKSIKNVSDLTGIELGCLKASYNVSKLKSHKKVDKNITNKQHHTHLSAHKESERKKEENITLSFESNKQNLW